VGAIGAVSFASDHDGDEWYTPPEYIEAAREVLGGIDLDPASNPIAQRTVKATRYFTKDDDGLTQKWGGHVWLNPPFSNPLGAQFVAKLCEEYDAGRVTEAVLLQNAATGTIWFHRLGRRCSAMCFPQKRIAFLRADGKRHDGNRYDQVFFYFGPDVELFTETFGALGLVVTPERRAA
jgi:phage N-6-adenine-methyltransferase